MRGKTQVSRKNGKRSSVPLEDDEKFEETAKRMLGYKKTVKI